MRTIGVVAGCAAFALWAGVWVATASAQFGGGGGKAPTPSAETYQAAARSVTAEPPPALLCECVGETDEPSIARIHHALSQPLKTTGLDFAEQPLEDVANFLQEEYDIPIQIDVLALEDAGLNADIPVSVNIQNVSLKSALRLMLRQQHLTWMIENGVLTITTPERAEEDLVTCVYDVRDLVTDGKSFENLADTISSCVAGESWAKNGGAAEIRPLQPGLLVIAHTRISHEEIGQLLATIRKMQSGASANTLQPNASGEKGIQGDLPARAK